MCLPHQLEANSETTNGEEISEWFCTRNGVRVWRFWLRRRETKGVRIAKSDRINHGRTARESSRVESDHVERKQERFDDVYALRQRRCHSICQDKLRPPISQRLGALSRDVDATGGRSLVWRKDSCHREIGGIRLG